MRSLMLKKRIHLATWIAALALVSHAKAQIQTLEPEQFYTWGINNSSAIPVEKGQVITEVVLTFHNFGSDITDVTTIESTRTISRGGTTSTSTVETPNYDSLKIYILDNPRYGFLNLSGAHAADDPFVGQGGQIDGTLEEGNLVYRLSLTNDQNSAFSKTFNTPFSLVLSNGSSVTLSSSLLEFMDYAGAGCSVGFGMRSGPVRYYYDDITLSLTVQSYQGASTSQTLVYHVDDDMTPVASYRLDIAAINGTVVKSPDKAVYAEGETVTLTAIADAGYTFSHWADGLSTAGSPVYQSSDTLSFNGIDQYAALPTSGWSLNGTTFTLWAMPDTVSGSRYLLGHTVGQTVSSWDNRIQLYIRDGQLGLGLGDTHALNQYIHTLQAGRWYFIALTIANGVYQVYVDGTLSAAGAYTGLSQLNTFADLGNTGNTAYRDQEAFSGRIEEVKIFASVLDRSDIETLAAGADRVMENPITITIDANKAVTANFTQDPL